MRSNCVARTQRAAAAARRSAPQRHRTSAHVRLALRALSIIALRLLSWVATPAHLRRAATASATIIRAQTRRKSCRRRAWLG